MKIYVAHANNYEFKEKLYEPIKKCSSLKFITNHFIEYENEIDMTNKIEKFLENFKSTK